MKNKTIRALEIIRDTFQGEGTRIGEKVDIIRFKFCNLSCKFCDTYSTMQLPENEFSIEDNFNSNIIFSGGEPCLLRYQKEIVNFLAEFSSKHFKHITIETNGTMIPTTKIIKSLKKHSEGYLFSVSPKFEHINDIALAHLVAQPSQFKFIIEDHSQIQKIKGILPFCSRPIILQPCYSYLDTLEEYLEKVRKLIVICPPEYLVIPQLQHILYGNQTGI